MGYFQVRNDSRVVIYDRRGFIRLATALRDNIKIQSFPFNVSKTILKTVTGDVFSSNLKGIFLMFGDQKNLEANLVNDLPS